MEETPDISMENLGPEESADLALCSKCGEANADTLQAMAEAEAGDLVTNDTIADLFMNLSEED